ncbi:MULTISPECIES: MoaD/ThiS family protein [Arthrobacter]|uniref:MoaD/ThiS family protein n=2 Tax=Arthrobacter TaxID=1663 RepID=A0ABU9KME2_9MICC|nr:MoaD/ThiS family protein [Arthrobacter sp. YJM1]MDP5227838.1 MoaD/ThiS family protein [Arthrobacter sp. YJM1]
MTVRYFAAARAAAGAEEERFDDSAASLTLAGLLETLTAQPRDVEPSAPELARVLSRSSFLVNGVAAKDREKPLSPGDTVDVLPPFAGG